MAARATGVEEQIEDRSIEWVHRLMLGVVVASFNLGALAMVGDFGH